MDVLRKLNFKKTFVCLLVAAMSTLLWSMMIQQPVYAEGETIVLTVTGDGVEKTVEFTLSDLQQLTQVTQTYSAYNGFPAWKTFTDMTGPSLKSLLDQAGLKDEATLITIKGSDGYQITFTRQQLLEQPRYYFPHGNEDNSQEDKVPVEPVLALNASEGLLVFGQAAPQEETNESFVKKMCLGGKIEVGTAALEQWEPPTADPTGGSKAAGTQVTLTNQDRNSFIYYTLDGSEPSVCSFLYNISEFKENKPIDINEDVTLKARTIGFGKLDSEVVSYEYTIDQTVFTIEGAGWTEPMRYTMEAIKNMTDVERDYVYYHEGNPTAIKGKGVLLSTLLDELGIRNDQWEFEFKTIDGNEYATGTVQEIRDQQCMIAYQIDGQDVADVTGDQVVNFEILRHFNEGQSPGNRLKYVSGIEVMKIEADINVSDIKLLNLDADPISTVADGGGYCIEAQIANQSDTAKNVLIVIQVRNGTGATAFSGGNVVECVAMQTVVDVTGDQVTTEFTLPDDLSGKAYVDIFLWDNFNSLSPLGTPNHELSFDIEG